MAQANVRHWLLSGVLVATSTLGTVGCQKEERRISEGKAPYTHPVNVPQPLDSFGPGTGGAGFQNIAPVQDRVGENLPPTAVDNVPPKVLPGVAAGSPESIEKLQQQEREGVPPPQNEREVPMPSDAGSTPGRE